jgi:hypothetical protein
LNNRIVRWLSALTLALLLLPGVAAQHTLGTELHYVHGLLGSVGVSSEIDAAMFVVQYEKSTP